MATGRSSSSSRISSRISAMSAERSSNSISSRRSRASSASAATSASFCSCRVSFSDMASSSQTKTPPEPEVARDRRATRRRGRGSALAGLLAQLLDGAQLGHGLSEFGGGAGVVQLRRLVVECLQRMLTGLLRGGLVEVTGAGCGVGQDGHHVRLYFEEAAGNVEVLFLSTVVDHANRARLKLGQQRSVTGQDAQISHDPGRDELLDLV